MNDPVSIQDVEALLAQAKKGVQPKYLFFWGHEPRKDGQIGKQCFSQGLNLLGFALMKVRAKLNE